MEDFVASCNAAAEYPRNLIYHDTYEHNLAAYEARLDRREEQLFSADDSASLELEEHDLLGHGIIASTHSSVAELKDHLYCSSSAVQSDPVCRYAFLHAPNSRERLYTSRKMLGYVLTYYQVMPSFLDFLFPFGRQEHARDFQFSGFRQESRLEPIYKELQIPEIGRSGRELRMCYSLKSAEPWEYNPSMPWSIRQTAIYHSLDVETGKAFWIIAKADDTIRDRIEDSRKLSRTRKILGDRAKKGDALAESLATHMIICDWCGEDWRWYISHLEESLQGRARHTLAATVDSPSSPVQERPPKAVTWNTVGEKRLPRSNSTLKRLSSLRINSFAKSPAQEVLSDPEKPARSNSILKTSTPPSPQQPPSFTSGPPPPMPPSRSNTMYSYTGDISTPSQFSFSDLQKVQLYEDKANEVQLILESNIKVLQELKDHYQAIVHADDCPVELIQNCKPDLERFQKRITSVINDLEMQKSRAITLLHLLADRKSLLHSILDVQNIEASKLLALKAQESTENMEVMTKDMHILALKTTKETVSMRIITLVTLFFLPGTFISTIMSTDIVQFQTDSNGKSQEIFQLGALQLFLTICLPLMLLTFIAWYGVYWYVNRNDGKKRRKKLESIGAV